VAWLAHALSVPAAAPAGVGPSGQVLAMVSPSVPPATPWQGTTRHHGGHAVDATPPVSTNDRCVAHYSSQQGLGVTSGPFSMSQVTPSRRITGTAWTPRASLRAMSSSHTAFASMGPFVQTFDILIIPYSVSELTLLLLHIVDHVF
jgi:hypothetical protein